MPYYSNRYKPYKKYGRNAKKKVYFKKKTYRVTKNTRSTALTVAQNKTPLWGKPSQYIKNQLYYENGRFLTGSLGSIPFINYYANGIYDPYAPTGGHQVIGFDQIMLMYEHYCVIRSKLSVTFYNHGDEPVRAGIYINPDTSAPTSTSKLMENGLVKTVTLDPKGTDDSTKTLSYNCDVKTYFGKKTYRDLMDDEKLTGDNASNPLEGVYYTTFAFNAFGGIEDTNVSFDVMISYDTIYFEPKKLDIS